MPSKTIAILTCWKEVAEAINEIDNSLDKAAKPFTTIDINGESISLSNFKGRYDNDNITAQKMAVEKDKVDIWYNILSGFKINNTGEIDESKWINKNLVRRLCLQKF